MHTSTGGARRGRLRLVCLLSIAAVACSDAASLPPNPRAGASEDGASAASGTAGDDAASSGATANGGMEDSATGAGGGAAPGTGSGSGSGAGTSGGAPPGAPVGTTLSLDAQGRYTVTFQQPAWTFGGSLGVAPTAVTKTSGSDRLGAYHEITFGYTDTAAKTGGIRAYDTTRVVLFTVTYKADAPNNSPFPKLGTLPQTAHHVSYADAEFAPISFTGLTGDSPWVFFDTSANTFILSAANHFMNASTARGTGGEIESGIAPAIAKLPAGLAYQTVLVAEPGINAAYDVWGHALTAWWGKSRPASDATRDLERFAYWTDNGSSYYYRSDAAKGYTGTLLAVNAAFQKLGMTLGAMQIDSWFYPKGPQALWQDSAAGEFLYEADKALFPNDLAPFQQALGLPLITHARWIDPSSPYRRQYKMSNNVSVDPAFWQAIAAYLAKGGVTTYEQDWLNQKALPATSNLNDQDAFMDNMASAMAAQGISMQYCMPLPRHILQSAKYGNLHTTRVSIDRFSRPRWHDFLYTSRLASAVGAWPWTDVFMSSEEDNLLLSTLSGGMVGVGDALGALNAANIFRSARPDGVIVKPDTPLVPIDQTFLNEASGKGGPLVAATRTDFGGMFFSYVFAFNAGAVPSASFVPASLGHTGKVFVFDTMQGTGELVDASASYSGNLASGRAYYIVAPVGPSGIALLGDAGKFVGLGKKRVSQVADNGTVSLTLAFAPAEGPITLHGYAPQAPKATASTGSVGPVTYDATTHMFTVAVTPAHATAKVALASR